MYKKYKVSLLTISPVHIGSGQKLTSKEYILVDDYYYFPDMGKLYQFLSQKGLAKKFERFLMSEPNMRLQDFFIDNGITAINFGGYKIKQTGFENNKFAKKQQINELNQFIRDAHGNPYIPGSSLKGALRTIYYNVVLWNKKLTRVNGIKFIDWGAKPTKKYSDLFNAIRVSDSKPLNNDRLIVSRKIDISEKKELKKGKRLPAGVNLFRESLAPLTPIVFEIVAATKEAEQVVENLQIYADDFYDEYSKFFLNGFEASLVQHTIVRKLKQHKMSPLYLGAGSGIWSKTKIKDVDLTVRRGGIRTPMIGKGALKLTSANPVQLNLPGGQVRLIDNEFNYYEMGKVIFKIDEV